MIILKFLSSLIIVFIFIIVLFSVLGLLIFQKFFSDLFDAFNNGKSKRPGGKINNNKDIPTIVQCRKCGAYYTEIPDDRKCSCGNDL